MTDTTFEAPVVLGTM